MTREDLLDAVQMTLVKGDLRVHGGAVERVAAEVMVGHLRGQVTAAAGAVSLLRDYYAQCKAHRIDVTGATKTVRCDLGRTAEHRHKSAFLHQCALLEVPMFTGIAEGSANPAYPGGFYKGPDLATGENLHLLGETWGVRWSERVDERLLDLSDRGATVAAAASERVRVSLAQEVGNAEASTRLLLRAAQMGLTDLFDDALTAVEEAIADDTLFEHLTAALRDFVMLYAYRDTLPTRGHARVLGTIEALFARCASTLPAVVYAQGDLAPRVLDGMQTLVRVALSFDAARLDRALLVARLQEMVALPDGNPTLRGAGYGVLYSLGATRERVVAEALDAYLQGDDEEALRAGPFLDGLFLSARNIFLGSTRLLRVVNAVLGRLDWARFKRILPDLRRAFTQFIPTEIDQIGQRVSETVGLDAPPPRDLPVPPRSPRWPPRATATSPPCWTPGAEAQTFFTNSDFSAIAPKPSILQSMLWSPSTRRICFTFVPTLSTDDEPLSRRSFTTVTVSPSCSTVPWASRTTSPSDSAAAPASAGDHSCAHSGHTSIAPSS